MIRNVMYVHITQIHKSNHNDIKILKLNNAKTAPLKSIFP